MAHIGQKLALRPARRFSCLCVLLQRNVGALQFFRTASQFFLGQSALSNLVGNAHRSNYVAAPVSERNLVGDHPGATTIFPGLLLFLFKQGLSSANNLLFVRKRDFSKVRAEEVEV